MSGKHEPPSRRSFYLSLAGSTLKLAVLVAGVVAGVLLLSRGFADETPEVPQSDGTAQPTATPTPTATRTTQPPPTCQRQGVIVAVYNGTSVDGLAGLTADRLETEFGYVVEEVGDAASPFQVTTFYFRNAQGRAEAQCLQEDFFRGAQIQRLQGQAVPENVQVALYLGSDYAAANPPA